MRLTRSLSFLALALLFAAGPAIGAPPKSKAKAKPKSSKPAAAEPAPDDGSSAVAACKSHIEQMLSSTATKFQHEQDTKVQKVDADNYDITGDVDAKNTSGQPVHADFTCHAKRVGGAVWSTKTSLSYAR